MPALWGRRGGAGMAGSGLIWASQLGSYPTWAGSGRGGHPEGRQGRRKYDYGRTKLSRPRSGCNKPKVMPVVPLGGLSALRLFIWRGLTTSAHPAVQACGTVCAAGHSQQLPCCETGLILYDPESLKSDPWPTSRDLSGTINGSLGSPRYPTVPQPVFKLPRQRPMTPVALSSQPLPRVGR